MSTGEMIYLIGVIVAFTFFGVCLAAAVHYSNGKDAAKTVPAMDHKPDIHAHA